VEIFALASSGYLEASLVSHCALPMRYDVHLDLLALKVAAEPLRRFVFLDAGPYRLEGGRVGRSFMFAAGLETDGVGRKD
jgi:hypothetical protein